MGDTSVVQLVTLWFVVMIFLQTGSGNADGPLITAVGVLAILLTYIVPLTLLVYAVLHLTSD